VRRLLDDGIIRHAGLSTFFIPPVRHRLIPRLHAPLWSERIHSCGSVRDHDPPSGPHRGLMNGKEPTDTRPT
jgi:hypothetical protein